MQPTKNGMRHLAIPPMESRKVSADDRRDEDRDLLTGRLERGVKAAIARCRDLGKIDRDAAQFDAGGEPLYQPANQHNDRRGNADGCVRRAEGDHHGTKRHERERHDQPLAAADAVDIGAEHDCADRAHQRAEPEHTICIEQGRGLVPGGEERFCDILRIETEQEEIELLEKIAAGCAQDSADARFDLRCFRTIRLRHNALSPPLQSAEPSALYGADARFDLRCFRSPQRHDAFSPRYNVAAKSLASRDSYPVLRGNLARLRSATNRKSRLDRLNFRICLAWTRAAIAGTPTVLANRLFPAARRGKIRRRSAV